MAEIDQELGRYAPDFFLVREKVERILHDSFVTSPPVLPHKVAGSYGLKVIFTTVPPQNNQIVSGFYDVRSSTIYVNVEDPPDRQTFTIAHEFGHAVLHKDLYSTNPERYKVLLRGPLRAEKDPLEQEANTFAAHLLVPRMFLTKYYPSASIEELARLFIVSEEVIKFRLENERSRAA